MLQRNLRVLLVAGVCVLAASVFAEQLREVPGGEKEHRRPNASAYAIQDIRQIRAEGFLTGIKWCGPERFAVMSDAGLSVVSADANIVRKLSDLPLSTLLTWTADCSAIQGFYRQDGKTFAVSVDGSTGRVTQVGSSNDVTALALFDNGAVIFLGAEAVAVHSQNTSTSTRRKITSVISSDTELFGRSAGSTVRLTPALDTFDFAKLAPGGRLFAYRGAHSGLNVVDLTTGNQTNVGFYTTAEWIDSEHLLVGDERDDGFRVTDVRLAVVDVHTGVALPVLAPPDFRGSIYGVSSDGTRIAYITDGQLYVGRLREPVRR